MADAGWTAAFNYLSRLSPRELATLHASLHHPGDTVIHESPGKGEAITPCCGRSMLELPVTDRVSFDPRISNCRALAAQTADRAVEAMAPNHTAGSEK